MDNGKKILAVDVGHGNTKFVWGPPNQNTEFIFPSIAPMSKNNSFGFGGELDQVCINVNDKDYLVGPDAYRAGGQPVLDDHYIARPEYLALLRGAIAYMMKKSGKVFHKLDCLVLGLPVSNFERDKVQLSQIAKGIQKVPVPKGLTSTYGDYIEVKVEAVLPMPQPIGALRASVMKVQADESSLVLDPGFNTFDWVVSVKNYTPDYNSSGSLTGGGVSKILKTVSLRAAKELGCGVIDFNKVEEGLKTGKIHIRQQTYQFDQFRQIAEDEAASIVDSFMNSFSYNEKIDNIILVGGGANYYLKAIQNKFKEHKVSIDSDSVMTNVRGFYLYGCDAMSNRL